MEMFDPTTLLLLAVLTVLFYVLVNRGDSRYWKDRNVPFIPPLFLLGNLKPLIFIEKCIGEFMADLHNAVDAVGHKFVGIYLFNNEPAILIRDPELVKHVLVKDFQHFADRNVVCDEKNDPVGYNNLFVVPGKKWKFLRSKLTPAFTSGRMKQMFLLIKERGNDLVRYLDETLKNESDSKGRSSVVLETKNIILKFTVDVISTCAFGIQSNSFGKTKSQFTHFADGIFRTTFRRALEWRLIFFVQSFVKLFKCVLMSRESNDFFRKVFHDTLNERESKSIYRNDFMDILIKLKNEQDEKLKNKMADGEELYEFKGDFLLAQTVLFFTAGFETSSTTISMALYELAIQSHLQDRLRTEITTELKAEGGDLTYDAISRMPYLTMVVNETLRKYPPLPFLGRFCTMDYKIPGTDVVIKKGTQVFISLYKGLQYDPEQFPMPEKFDPERFSDENKRSIHPYAYIPFGEGPRNCIGMRFGYMTVKTGLCMILSRYKVEICEKTPIPLEIENRALMLTVKGGCNLKFVKL